MQLKTLLGLATAVLLAGCSSHQLTSAGEQVKFVEGQPAAECQRVGSVTGTQSNWFSGSGNEGSVMRAAANDLRNQAAAMGGNTVYGVNSPSENLLSSFVPLDSKMTGQVYKCP